MISFGVLSSTFLVIFVAELPDKTALATLLLATKYRARDVIIGAGLAFLIQTLVGVAAGSVLILLPATPVRIASGIGFLIFAILAWRQRDEDEEGEEEEDITRRKSLRPPWLLTFLVVFAAEWGDLTQLATAALAGQTRQPLSVGIGAILALWAVTILAAFGGSRLAGLLKPKALKIASALLFAAIGLYLIASPFLTGVS